MLNGRERVRLNQYKDYLKRSVLLDRALIKTEYLTKDTFSIVNGYVLGPAISIFVLWVLREALNNNKRRLYFLARDGYFMYLCAKIFCEKFNLSIECRYLSCSRYSLRIPMFHLNPQEALEYICRAGIDVTLSKILNRAGLNEAEKQDVYKALNDQFDSKRIISYPELAEIRKALSQCECFMDYMLTHSQKSMPDLAAYLEQEGLLEEGCDAIVDSGWVGSMQKTLNQILAHLGRKSRITGYYWGLYELPQGVSRNDYECFYFKPEKGLREKVYFSNCLYEAIFSAPHGMTLRYERDGRLYYPVYGEVSKEKYSFIQRTEHEVLSVANRLTAEIVDISIIDFTKERKVLHQLIKLFMGHPTVEEVKLYGNLLFSDDVLETEQQPVAAILDDSNLKANHVLSKTLLMLGIKKGYIKESAWYEGSAVRNQKHVERHLTQYAFYKYLLYLRKSLVWRKNNV